MSEKGSEFVIVVIVARVEAKLSLFVHSGDVFMIGRGWSWVVENIHSG